MDIESFRQIKTARKNGRRLAFLELLTEPKIFSIVFLVVVSSHLLNVNFSIYLFIVIEFHPLYRHGQIK